MAKPKLPKVVHIKAPRKPAAPRVSHAGTKGLVGTEAAIGAADNADLAAALDGGYAGTGATLPAGATPYTGPFNAEGMPAPGTRGTIKIPNPPHGPAIKYFTAAQRSTYARTHSLAAALAVGTGSTAAGGGTHTGSTHTPKITAPLQLTDSGLLGHDSHISNPPALAPLAPIVRRRPGH